MDEDEILAVCIGVFLFIFGVLIMYTAWKRQAERERNLHIEHLLDVV